MYGCDCHIGCLSGSVTRIGQGLSGLITPTNDERALSGSITRVGQELYGMITNVSEVEERLTGSIIRIGGGLSGYISMVCSTSKDAYLEVSTDVIWLTPDMFEEEFDIYSNVSWVID